MNQIFETIKSEMDVASVKQNFEYFRSAAKRLNLVEENLNSLVSIRYQYSIILPTGEVISGSMRSYDQSGPFQNLPDMNKIEMQLINNGQIIDEHKVSWED